MAVESLQPNGTGRPTTFSVYLNQDWLQQTLNIHLTSNFFAYHLRDITHVGAGVALTHQYMFSR